MLASAVACSDGSENNIIIQNKKLASNKSALTNNEPIANGGGEAATYSTTGSIDLGNAFHTPQGLNGRSCGTCHSPEAGWSITPV